VVNGFPRRAQRGFPCQDLYRDKPRGIKDPNAVSYLLKLTLNIGKTAIDASDKDLEITLLCTQQT